MSARLLDISRLVSRVGRGPHTGIDRVEIAYFHQLLQMPEDVFFLARIPKGYVLLDRSGGRILFNKIKGITPWGSRDVISRLSTKLSPIQQQCHSDLRAHGIGKCLSGGLGRMLKTVLPDQVSYFNVGHSNFRHGMFHAINALPKSKIIVLIHDFIPLDYPEFTRQEVSGRFLQDMRRVSEHADLVICNSSWTAERANHHFSSWNQAPQTVVAHLGTETDMSDAAEPIVNNNVNPYFVVLGTIEPRKNHQLLLNIWQRFHQSLSPMDIPNLHIAGQRGWSNESVFKILDNDPIMNSTVFEHNKMSDSDVKALLRDSHGLLFPSFAEGYGLPLMEAAQLGVPIICGENAIYREILGDYPLYLNVDNSYGWSNGILERAGRKRESEVERQMRAKSVTIPTWQSHFDQIFRFV